MDKETLQRLLAEAQQNKRAAFGQLAWTEGRIAQLEELLMMLDTVDKAEEDDGEDTSLAQGGGDDNGDA